MNTLDEIIQLRDSLNKNLEQVLAEVKQDSVVDDLDLDAEALRITTLHGKWVAGYSSHKVAASRANSTLKRLILERWKYYCGKQTDAYYAANGFLHEKILKGDVEKYMDADILLIEMKECVNIQYQIVDTIEKMLKELNSRGFNIKNAIEWRKFQAGA